jgi:hypothetical protein
MLEKSVLWFCEVLQALLVLRVLGVGLGCPFFPFHTAFDSVLAFLRPMP